MDFRTRSTATVTALLLSVLAPVVCYWEADWKPGARCGDHIVDRERGETCDGDCPESCDDDNPCVRGEMIGSAQECNVVCEYQTINECKNDDHCCPAGCNSGNDGDCSDSCGNGQVEADKGETCDPPETCPSECDDSDDCTKDEGTGSAANCNFDCSYLEITECKNDDRCCPQGCSSANDNDCNYPPPPYGTEEGGTAYNFCVTECLCSGRNLESTRKLCVEEFVGVKVTMVVVSSGTCSSCKLFTNTLEQDYNDAYAGRGLKMLVVLYADEGGNQDESSLLQYCCPYKNDGGMTFTVAVDPYDWAMGRFHNDVPLTMLLGPDMNIEFKEDGATPNEVILRGNIEDLL